ncbi:MAG: hypothetical protein ACRDQ5_26820, partial [Sciscionella sp.]
CLSLSKAQSRSESSGWEVYAANRNSPIVAGSYVRFRYGTGTVKTIKQDEGTLQYFASLVSVDLLLPLCSPSVFPQSTPAVITVESTNIDVPFASLEGNVKGSVRASHCSPILLAPQCKKRSDALPAYVKTTICSFFCKHCQMSPNVKDVVRHYLGPRQWEEARTLYRFQSWTELWKIFKEKCCGVATMVSYNSKLSDTTPIIFRDAALYEMKKGKDVGC